MIATSKKAAFDRLFAPLASVLVKHRVSPTAVTLAGLALSLASCAYLLMTRRVAVFCWLIAASALFDALDGAVARRGGRVTKFGAYLDAVCDRYVDAAVVLCAAIVTGYWVLSMVTLAGSMLVSYTKARAAMEVPISNCEWPDLMERMERGALFVIGLLLGAVVPWRPGQHDLFWWTLVALAVLTHGTVMQRILRARRLIASRS